MKSTVHSVSCDRCGFKLIREDLPFTWLRVTFQSNESLELNDLCANCSDDFHRFRYNIHDVPVRKLSI